MREDVTYVSLAATWLNHEKLSNNSTITSVLNNHLSNLLKMYQTINDLAQA